MLSLRAHAIICAALFAAIVLLAAGGNALVASGMVKQPTSPSVPVMVLFFGLFLAFGFSAVPVMVKLVLRGHQAMGTDRQPIIRDLVAHQNLIIWVIWSIMLLGVVVAVPAAILGGMFGPAPGQAVERALTGKSQGVLAARPGMSIDEVVRDSSLKIDIAGRPRPIRTLSGAGLFDFQIPGSGIRLSGCRYYFLSTSSADPDHVEGMSIGVSTGKLTRSELEAADAELRQRLAADGWLAGHEVYRDEADRRLHGGAGEGPEGQTWLKDGMVLDIRSRRMDDATQGEDPATAGQWIQYVELWNQKTYAGIERLVFARPRA